jgi:two-component system cell cycle sensor histidine kinase PleC
VQTPLTRNHKGSGLGLAISRSLVALHGGEMRILSKEGAGTTVSVFFPFVIGRPLAGRGPCIRRKRNS